MRGIRAYWGYVAAGVLVAAWGNGGSGLLIIILSLAVSAFALFQVPTWCGAVNRDGKTYCRKNAAGILMGCELRQHRWQKMKLIVLRSKAGDLTQAVFPNAKEKFAGVIAVGGLVSAVAAVVVPQVTGQS
ncbi:hypothetical protein [Streptomyces albofaciens]|uniref:hypothetical protein n=1 Tax=Streptomyces albofaciens TaxID=66866 RepID=UPI00123B509E|nr:hypothetical protein [Streptomyces albofaciens]